MKAIMESLPGGVEKPKIYMGLLVGTRGTNRSLKSPVAQPCMDQDLHEELDVCVCLGAPMGRERSGSVLTGTT